ncbi:response regulator transcription factor [Enterococcus saccharolyticus]|uniref:DNA-binding response regulator n=1 Tax=Candidatus Enterococcus willemsii TaxID=1857215 RepID=A0ABQ6YZU9_9ENTE|nr:MULTISPECIES: LytTR family DNA-binding domain-containing protein [Enterococcus]KAF1304138.1 DNA-binding response regulator [Enterococcus sp. CU12B]MCD5001988.1 response regulator transcription factor [Enterococcus saccharolyticus]
MLNIFICEDNLIQRTKLETLINNYLLMEDLDMHIALSTANPDELLEYVTLHPQNQGIYFLDVDLNHQMDGIQLGAAIRDLCIDGKIIFTTTHSEKAPLTFKYKVEAMDYIPKDDPQDMTRRIKEALQQAQKHYTSENKVLTDKIRLKVGSQIRVFDLSDIMFFETSPAQHKLILHLTNGSVEFYGKITEVEQLSEHFIRVHKSFVANQQTILHVDQKKRILTFINNETCLVSIRQISQLNHTFKSK